MAVSTTPRKKKSAKISKAERRLRKLHRELGEFIDEYQRQQVHIRQWDMSLRIFAQRLRAILLQPCHPELIEKYLPGYKPETELSKEEWEQVDLIFFGFVKAKNYIVNKLRGFDKEQMESIRALLQITSNRCKPEVRKANRKRVDEIELDTVNAILQGTALIDSLSNFTAIYSDTTNAIKKHAPTVHAMLEASHEAFKQYLGTLPTGGENVKKFREDEIALEDHFVARWKEVNEEYTNKILQMVDDGEEASPAEDAAANDVDVDAEVTAISEEREEEYHEQSNL